MVLKTGRNITTNDESALSSGTALNSTTSVKIQDSNTKRRVLIVSNPSNDDVWLKLQAATTDDDKKGIHMPARSYWESQTDNIYTGEVSAIAESGSPTVYTTEY